MRPASQGVLQTGSGPTSYLSRVFLYWADNPGRVEDKTLVNVEVDLATGEVKNLRMMQPIKVGQTPK